MDREQSFTDEVCKWFMSRGFDCMVVETFFSEIEISRENRVLLKITLVSLHEWRTGRSLGTLGEAFKKVRSQREEGRAAIMLWQDYWLGREEIVKSRLLAMLGTSQKIPARLTQVRRIDKLTSQAFLEKYHLNGSVGSKYQYGLFLPKRYFRILNADFQHDREGEEMLVAVATFSHPRIFQRPGKAFRSYELIRFASIEATNVVGGLDKLLKAFSEEKKPDDIMTYADLEWSDGRSYARLGFEPVSETPPMSFLLDLKSNRRFTSPKERPLKEDADIQHVEDITTVFNAGSMKYVKTVST
ncbi:hypothetical protein [Dyadobacter bucti]|uniref:hypothetical protein n=1 Tax=Dyadobacter bucti TaxID=2572203 RepID=UPI003F710FCD